jgi:hypothetical protein
MERGLAAQRDLFVSYNSADRDAVDSVRRAFHAKGISTFYDRDDLTPGQPWFDELEGAVRSVRGAAVFIGPGGLGTIQKREMQFLMVRQADEEAHGKRFPVIPVLLHGADPDAISGFLTLNTWLDLRGGFDDGQAFNSVVGYFQGQPPERAEAEPVRLCPYRGLNTFREEDWPLFFGRQEATKRIFELVLKQRLVTVTGRSGSGKSSIAQAGLLPLLRRQKPPAETWESIVFSPGARPFSRLAAQLVPLWSPPGRDQTDIGTESEKLGNRLAEGEVNLAHFVELALKHLPNTSRLIAVVDQFEELFTQTAQPEQRKRFTDELLDAAAESKLTIVLVLRADFYAQAISLDRRLSDRIASGLVNVTEMTRSELREAIEQPTVRTGACFEKGLVDRILDHLETQPGSLPLLEYALTELWQQRQGNVLTHASYDVVGGVAGAISKRAEQQFDKLLPGERDTAMPALSRLVHLSSGMGESSDTRRVVRLDELDTDATAVMRVFAARESRLVVLGFDEATGEETAQVAHEALIRGWERLRSWIGRDREFLLWRQQLRPFIDKWQALKQDRGTALLQGIYLAEARRWLRDRGRDLNLQEREFIQASERPVVQSRRRRQFAAAILPVLCLSLLGAADLGLSFPGSGQFRDWIDELNISAVRRPRTAAQLREATNKLISDVAAEVERRKFTTGWIRSTSNPADPFIDHWGHSEGVCALLHSSLARNGARNQAGNDARGPAEGLRMLFAPDLRVERDGRKYGWASGDPIGTDIIRVETVLWAGSGLAALAARGLTHSGPWTDSAFEESVRYVQESSVAFRNDARSGWRIYPVTSDPSVYPTVLSTQMLMDLRDARVLWPGADDLNTLIRGNLEWLISQYHSDGGAMPGWKEGAEVQTVPGLTLQAYAVLLRAQARGDIQIARPMMNAVTQLVMRKFQDGAAAGMTDSTAAYKNIVYISPIDGTELHPAPTTRFVWYPWAIECVARWLDLQPDHRAALNDSMVRRTLTVLLTAESQVYLQKNPYYTFRYSEMLYALGSLSRTLSAAGD